MNMNDLEKEAEAFDAQIIERVKNGHVPDLRRVKECDYFVNNPWRHPDYVKLDFGYLFEKIKSAIEEHTSSSKSGMLKVLEVGCGPGYISLELARSGYDVTGVDISDQALNVARELAETEPWKRDRGPLQYVNRDFLLKDSFRENTFDAVVFLGALHHFPRQKEVGEQVFRILKDGGIIIAHEPTRDRITEGAVELGMLVRTLLSVGGGYYKQIGVSESDEKHQQQIDELKRDIEFITEGGDKVQSPNDNEAGYAEMHEMLSGRFNRIVEEDTFSFFHEVIGGLRFDQQTNSILAKYLRDTDKRLVEKGIMPAYEFFFVGRKDSSSR